VPKASRETSLLIYEIIRDSPGDCGVSIAEIKSAVGKSRGLVSAVLSDLRASGCVVGLQGERRVIRYSVVELFPLSDAEKAARFDRIKELVEGQKSKLAKQIMEVLNGD
jgi:hypothetical protein